MTNLEIAARALLAHWDTPAWKYLKPTGDLMADLREALAEQVEQEPVAWLYRGELHWENPNEWAKGEVTPLYTDIPQSNKEQHPIARVPAHPEQGLEWLKPPPVWGTLLYAAPVRTKDLTDDEIVSLAKQINGIYYDCDCVFARAVIAADREKNLG